MPLFQVGHVVQTSRSVLSLAWHVYFSCKGRKLNVYRCELALSSQISRRHLADYGKKLHKKACRTCSTIIFPHSTNQIIGLWCCRSSYRRPFLNSLITVRRQNLVVSSFNDGVFRLHLTE